MLLSSLPKYNITKKSFLNNPPDILIYHQIFQVTDDIAALLKSLKLGEIPESWLDLCYPTMDDLDGFLVTPS